MRKCPAFRNGFNCEGFSDCSFFINDVSTGGPSGHGPCATCEWNQKFGFFKGSPEIVHLID
jgi:hypothetical protein